MTWIGQNVRDKDGVPGKIVDDSGPGITSYLDIAFANGRTHTIQLCFFGDALDPLAVEWEFNPGKWSRLTRERSSIVVNIK